MPAEYSLLGRLKDEEDRIIWLPPSDCDFLKSRGIVIDDYVRFSPSITDDHLNYFPVRSTTSHYLATLYLQAKEYEQQQCLLTGKQYGDILETVRFRSGNVNKKSEIMLEEEFMWHAIRRPNELVPMAVVESLLYKLIPKQLYRLKADVP
jgi:hypothetical protein